MSELEKDKIGFRIEQSSRYSN